MYSYPSDSIIYGLFNLPYLQLANKLSDQPNLFSLYTAGPLSNPVFEKQKFKKIYFNILARGSEAIPSTQDLAQRASQQK